MKKTIALLCFICIYSVTSAQKAKNPPIKPFTPTVNVACVTGCSQFTNSNMIISVPSLTYSAAVDNVPCYEAPSGFNNGCLGTYNNQKWFIVKVTGAGNITLPITNSAGSDVDAAIWGPINSYSAACSILTNTPVSCDYFGDANPVITVNNAQVGQWYVLLVTNYSNIPTDITLSQPTTGSVTYEYTCENSFDFTNPLSGTRTFRANDYINSSSAVSNNINFSAKNKIELNAGFKTQPSAVFKAEIRNCATPTYTLTLQPGPTNGKDCDFGSIVPNTTNPTGKFIDPYAWTQSGNLNVKRCLIQFDLSSIPTNAVVDSAILSLYFSQKLIQDFPNFTGHFGANSMEIKRVTQNWQPATATWNNQPTTTTTNMVIVPQATNQTQDYPRIVVTSLVQDQLANTNFGFLIKHQSETAYKITCLTASEEDNAAKRPKLVVYYH